MTKRISSNAAKEPKTPAKAKPPRPYARVPLTEQQLNMLAGLVSKAQQRAADNLERASDPAKSDAERTFYRTCVHELEMLSDLLAQPKLKDTSQDAEDDEDDEDEDRE